MVGAPAFPCYCYNQSVMIITFSSVHYYLCLTQYKNMHLYIYIYITSVMIGPVQEIYIGLFTYDI